MKLPGYGVEEWSTISSKPVGPRRSRCRKTARKNLGGHRRVSVPKNREFMDAGIAGMADPASAFASRLPVSLQTVRFARCAGSLRKSAICPESCG